MVNALKYSSGERDVIISTEDLGNKERIIVSNETDRLTEGDLDSIWTPFYRLDKVRDRDGHGLGLSIVRGILENHKSKFGVYFLKIKL